MIPSYAGDTRWKDIYDCLKTAGIDVYSPGQHDGTCTSPYAVVRFAGRYKKVNYSTNDVTYEILCYVPVKNYTMLDTFSSQVKTAMIELWPMVKTKHNELPDYLDDDLQAHMRTLQYLVHEQIV